MRKASRLKALQALTQMALDVDMMKMSALARREQKIADDISALRADALAEHGAYFQADVADLSGISARADARDRWFLSRLKNMNAQLAQIQVNREELRKYAVISFGRHEALNKSVAKLRTESFRKAGRPE